MAFRDTIIGKWLHNDYLRKGYEPTTSFGNTVIDKSLDSLIAKYTGSSLTNAEQETNAFNAAEAQKNRDFQERMANTQVQRQVSDMQAAGLNPGMMYGSAPSPMSTSGSAASASTPGAGLDLISAVISAFMAPLQAKQLKADTVAAGKAAEASAATARKADSDTSLNKAKEDEIRAGIRRTEEETRGLKLANDIREITKDVEIDSKRLANEKTRQETREIEKRIDEITANIDLLIKKAATEAEQKSAVIAKRILDQASARQINELLPYAKYKMSAEGSAQYNAAGLSLAHTLYQNKLIDSGYIETMVDNMAESARKAGKEADIAFIREKREQINLAIRTGDWSKFDGSEMSILQKYSAGTLGAVTVLMDNLNPLSGFAK